MELTHRFSVPVPVDVAWAHFNDIASVAECFPGATVSSADGDSFQGSVKVKLGPIALVYNGSGTFTEKDEAAHRFVVDAKGKDKRGNGTAGAVVTLQMTEAGDTTDVEVLTDLAITGTPAQFGRGVMQDVSDKLLGQFMTCLEERLTAREPGDSGDHGDGGDQARGTTLDNDVNGHLAEPTGEVEAPAPTAASAASGALGAPAPTPPLPPAASRRDEALDLGATVLPVLVRSYWKQGVVALVLLVLLIWLIVAL